ncbi:MAG: PadR family transcriptional regulator [Sphingobium sp.]
MHFHNSHRGHGGRSFHHGHGRFAGPGGFGRAFGGGGRGRAFDDDPFGGDGRGGRGGGRRRLFTNDMLQLILLRLIADSPRHGYDLIREIESLSGEIYAPSPGVVYPTLTLLADMGLIAEQPGESSRKLFAITEAGAAHLSDRQDEAQAVMDRLAHMAKKAERSDGAPIRRAMQNLAMAVRGRLQKEGVEAQTMLDVAALIDEAAHKIERL